MGGAQEDPRARRFVLTMKDEHNNKGLVALIDAWPVGKQPARLVAAGEQVQDLLMVAEYKAGCGMCITAHASQGSCTPCILLARKPPTRKDTGA